MSQSADLLALLSDGHPHEMRAIHRAIGFCRLNSRVSELRKRGSGIVCDKSNREYVYTLISRPLEAPSGSPSSRVDGTDGASSGSGLGVLPDKDRVDTNVQSPAPLDSWTEPNDSHSPEPSWGCHRSDVAHAASVLVLPGGQLTLRWAA